MRKLIIILLLCASYLTGKCQVVSIFESSGSDEYRAVEKAGIVDINSNLQLKINRETLALLVGSKTNANPQLVNELNFYNKLLIYQNDIQKLLITDLSKATEAEKLNTLGEFSDKVSDLIDQINTDEIVRAQTVIYFKEFMKLATEDKMKFNNYPIYYCLTKLADDKAEKLKQLNSAINETKIKIALTAFLNTKDERNKKVHIENFDDYSVGEFYQTERWVTSFSDKDIEAMNSTRALANKLNENVDKNFNEIVNITKSHIQSLVCIDTLIEKFNQVKNNRQLIIARNKNVIDSAFDEAKTDLNNLIEIATQLKQLDLKDANSLILFNTIQEDFISNAEVLPEKFETIFNNIPQNLKSSNAEIIDLIKQIEVCKAALLADKETFEKIKNLTTGLLLPSKKTAQNVITIGKEVKNFGINDMPEFGFIDLKTTGKRANSDELEIRLLIRTPEDIEKLKPGITIEKRTLTLQQIRIYSESNVSLIFASPVNASAQVKLQNKFQFAPSGSLLFKGGSRKSKAWNYLEPSIGFNMSTPDFDLDGVPEVGVGGVFTILKNVLSFGYAYNTKTDNPYWFFGLSLPFSTVGIPINTVQTNASK